MIVLDTNVVSEAQRLQYDANCARWLADQQIDTLYITTPTVAEMAFGGYKIILRDGSDRYIRTLDTVISRNFPSRVLPFDQPAAFIYGQIRAARQANGLPTPVIDLQIAAICLAHDMTLATRNWRAFEGLELRLINPFDASKN